MDPFIMGPLLILLFGAGVGAAFYFVARSRVGRPVDGAGRRTTDSNASLQTPDTTRR
jgi:hypothetical protein